MTDCHKCEQAKKILNEKKRTVLEKAKVKYAGADGFWLVLSINRNTWQHRAETEPTDHFPDREYISLLQ